MIEVKLSTIISSIEVLQRLANSSVNGRTAHKIARLLKSADEELTLFNDTRTKLIDKYAMKDEQGEFITENGNYKIDPNKVEQFNKEVEILMDTSIELNANKLQLDEIENIDITPADILLIDDFIEE